MSSITKAFCRSSLTTKLRRATVNKLSNRNFYYTTSIVSKTKKSNLIPRSNLLSSSISISKFSGVIPEKLEDINSDEIIINKTSNPGKMPPYEKLLFGRNFTDHMLEIDWNNQTGWSRPVIKPYGPLLLDPASSCLHYALEAFEGMKAYLDNDNNIRLFRPSKNMERLLRSCEALFFPQFNGEEFLQCIYELLRIDKHWIPKKPGYSLYIRPVVIGTHPHIGVSPSESVKLYVILSPVGPYYPRGFEPVNLYADQSHVRAWPMGVGAFKLGCNYGPTIKPQMAALAKGYDQVLWLYNDQVTEVGTMNLFIYWKNENDELELRTAPLDGTILPGVTRDSVLTITRDWNRFNVVEKPFYMSDVIKAVEEDRIIEMFGAGTAAIVCPVKGIGYNNKHYDIPLGKDDPNEEKAGPLAQEIYKTITDIQYGITPNHPWSVVVGKSDDKQRL